MNEKTNRIIWIDILRVFSIFCMILLHVAGSNWSAVHVESTEWQFFNIYDGLVRFCVPIFVMISGAFLLSPEKEYSMHTLFSKKILRLLTAFVFWSAAYALFEFVLYEDISVKDILSKIVYGHYHMWFIYMIIGLYIIVPLLRKICENKTLMQYFLLLSYIFVFLSKASTWIPSIGNIANALLDKLNISFVLGYTGYFILGSYLCRYPLNRRSRSVIYALGILSAVFTVCATSLVSLQKGSHTETFYSYLSPNVLFCAVSVFLFFQNSVSKIHFSERAKKTISYLSRLSFGIYLVHDFFIIIFSHFFSFTTLSFHASVSVPLITLIVFVCGYAVVMILDKIPLVRKYLI